MQVFLTNKDLEISAKELDDLRLGANCKEIVQLLCGMENLDYFVINKEITIGHSKHPIFEHYHCNEGQCFLVEYLKQLCIEWYYRFGKQNQAFFTHKYFEQRYQTYEESLYGDRDDYGWESEWKPAYIKGQKGKDQIITTDNVYERYRELLIDKWNNDKAKPKWTNRKIPKWYENDFNNTWLPY